MKNLRALIGLLALAVTACVTDQDSSVTLEIKSYLVPCIGVDQISCMVVSENGGAQTLFYTSIKGFTFSWGTDRTVIVEKIKVANPPEDGSSIRYVLREAGKSENVYSADFNVFLHVGTEAAFDGQILTISGYAKSIAIPGFAPHDAFRDGRSTANYRIAVNMDKNRNLKAVSWEPAQ